MMKKLITLLILFAMLLSLLASCAEKKREDDDEEEKSNKKVVGVLPKELSGTEAAKLLLAKERLNANLLKREGNIFDQGVQVMNNLADTAVANLGVRYTGSETPAVTNLSTTLKGNYIGQLEVDGNTFRWSDFEENNNSYDYFENLTENIVSNAKRGAKLIDSIKKNVRVVDKWVKMDSIQYYLHVDENSETLIERDTQDGFLDICMRYKNEDGKDVYELYRKQEKFESRMTYIPGERYEISMINSHGVDVGRDFFVADHSKGYWETYIVGAMETHYNISYFIMKDDVCYDAFYDPKIGDIPVLKVMSADHATDIFNFDDRSENLHVGIKFSGFDGIAYVEAMGENVEYRKGEYANLISGETGTVHLSNGKTLHYGDSFYDGKLEVYSVLVGYGAAGYTGEIGVAISGDTQEEKLALLKNFLVENGLICRRPIESVFEGLNRACVDLESVIRYYQWNGISVTTEQGIAEALSREMARFGEMEALYTAVQDAEVLEYADTKTIELNINFAPITDQKIAGATLNGNLVTVESISLTVQDTLLYVKEEPYQIAFAMVEKNGGGLVHLEVRNDTTVAYAGEKPFVVNAANVSFELPALAVGDYNLVSYIATADGIRASEYNPILVQTDNQEPVTMGNVAMSAKNNGSELIISYIESNDFIIQLTSKESLNYQAFRELVATEVFQYGTPSDEALEMLVGNDYVALSGNEEAITSGTYRIRYTVQNGEAHISGVIYVEYSHVTN